jgi:hypothetical protein
MCPSGGGLVSRSYVPFGTGISGRLLCASWWGFVGSYELF